MAPLTHATSIASLDHMTAFTNHITAFTTYMWRSSPITLLPSLHTYDGLHRSHYCLHYIHMTAFTDHITAFTTYMWRLSPITLLPSLHTCDGFHRSHYCLHYINVLLEKITCLFMFEAFWRANSQFSKRSYNLFK